MHALRKRDLLLSLKFGTVEACFSVPMLNLTLTQFPFVVAFAVTALGWKAGAIGWLAAAHHLCNAAQPPLMWLLRRQWSLHRIIVLGFLINLLPWALMGFLPWMGTSRDLIFAVVVVVATLGNSVCGVAWSAAMGELVPLHIRGRYFGRRNMIFGFWTLVVVLAAGFIADRYDNSLEVFGILFALSAAMRLVGLFFLLRMKFPASVLHPLEQREKLSDYLNVFQAKHYLYLLAFVGIWGFALNLAQPFYSVYVLRELPLTIRDLTILTSLLSLGGLLTLPSWGILGDRFGSKPVMMACSFLWVFVALPSWLLVGPDRHGFLYVTYFLTGAATAGFQLCQFNLMVKMIPARTKAPYISVFLAGISLMTAAGPLLGGQLLTALPHDVGTLLGEPLVRFHLVFVGSMVLCLLSTHILHQMQEPAERPLSELVRVMRHMRELNPILGLAAIAETVFTPRRLTVFAERSLRSLRRQTGDLAEVGEELAEAGLGAIKRGLRRTPPRPSDEPPSKP
ncbi:MAG: MFS transporter [Verrucomicrobiales bacterium]|nr:MFS transporter [Verrucomicrobiales bacterium]